MKYQKERSLCRVIHLYRRRAQKGISEHRRWYRWGFHNVNRSKDCKGPLLSAAPSCVHEPCIESEAQWTASGFPRVSTKGFLLLSQRHHHHYHHSPSLGQINIPGQKCCKRGCLERKYQILDCYALFSCACSKYHQNAKHYSGKTHVETTTLYK